jgi:DNA-directed RNA polymerase subunit RPC12/RpoP
MFHMANTKKIIKIKSSPVYDGNNWLPTKLLKSDDWREMDADALMKCDDCGHKSTEYAEHDDLIEIVGLEKEEHCQVRCPNCKSWYYWEVE